MNYFMFELEEEIGCDDLDKMPCPLYDTEYDMCNLDTPTHNYSTNKMGTGNCPLSRLINIRGGDNA